MTSWQPEIGDAVIISNGYLGMVESVRMLPGGKWIYKIRYRVSSGETSGWYTREQIERVK
jgi:hypothetical protein